MKHTQRTTTGTLIKASALTAAVLLGTPALSAPAHASGGSGDRAVSASRTCATGVIKVKAKTDNGAIEVEGEVDTNRNGQTWAWTIRRNGAVTKQGTAQTTAPSGSFSVARRISDPSGADTILFTAVRPATGQTCRVAVTL